MFGDVFLQALQFGAHIGVIPCDYSAYSGIVATVKVGRRGEQLISVGFDFNENESFFYSQAECPPLIGRCFDETLSSSFAPREVANPPYQFADDSRLSGIAATDELYIGQQGFFYRFQFHSITHTRPTSLAKREVGGMLGAGKASQLFSGKRVIVRECVEHRQPRLTVLEDGQDQIVSSSMITFPSLHPAKWSFSSQLYVSGSSLISPSCMYTGSVRFDPGFPNVALPRSAIPAFNGALEAQAVAYDIIDSRAYIECILGSIDLSFSMNLQVAPGSPAIRLTANQLAVLNPDRLPSVSVLVNRRILTVCPTRILFQPDIDEIVIGRVLLRSSEAGVVLNYTDKTISFLESIERRPPLGSYEDPTPRVDLHHAFPEIIRSGISFGRWHGERSGLALMGTRPRESDEFPGNFCWNFFRVGESPVRSRASSLRLSGHYSDISLHSEPHRTEIRLLSDPNASQKFKVAVRETDRGSSVCFEAAELKLEALELPSPEIFAPVEMATAAGSDAAECSICLSKYVSGDVIQQLIKCGHHFHKNCVKEWLVNRSQTCPVCRAKVYRRRSAFTTTSPPQTEADEPVTRLRTCCVS